MRKTSWLIQVSYASAFVFFANTAKAACTTPSGSEGQFQYITTEYKWCDGTSWQSMTVAATGSPCSVAGTMWYNANDILFCNGSNWVSMNGSTTNGSCSGTTIGTFRYNSSPKKMEWCDGTNWKFMAPSSGAPTGYFVLTSSTYTGNRGGLSGADSTCLTELTSNNWTGKASAGTLSAARVKAWLCDSTTCNNLDGNTTYKFATSADLSAGGASFTTDAAGQGPGDSSAWSSAAYFNISADVWTGRAAGTSTLWSNSPDGAAASTCSDWSIGATFQTARHGNTAGTNATRWNATISLSCGSGRRLICAVKPGDTTPDSFSFNDQINLIASTTTVSNIVQITGIDNPAAVNISGTSAEFRVCADSTCSANPAWGSSASTISNNQYLQLRATSAASGSLSVTIDVGGVTDNWSLTTAVTVGYFVLSNGTFAANFGTLANADASCLTDLQNNNWLGKSSAGMLTAARVKAFLCTSTTCNALDPATVYYYARSGDITAGGASFTTDISGSGPGDASNWSGVSYLNASATEEYWTGRAAGGGNVWPNTASAYTCLNWTSTAAPDSGQLGNAAWTTAARWSNRLVGCNGNWRLLCAVQPEVDVNPNAFSFTDQTGLSTSTLTTSNIVQITGMTAAATVSISGGGSPQFRVCADSTCSANPSWGSANSTISNNQYLQVRATSSAAAGTNTNVTVTVGGVQDMWRLTTAGTPVPGYFVLSAGTSKGNFGSLAAADTFCYNDLTNVANDWLGKSSAGTITQARVRAFLCDGTTCQNPQPDTVYKFARSGSSTAGGASFTSDSSGLGPNDSANWSGATYFGVAVSSFTGRAAGSDGLNFPNASGATTCTAWTSGSNAQTGVINTTNSTNSTRWFSVNQGCGTARTIICIVDP